MMTVDTTVRVIFFFFFQAEDGIRDGHVTGVQTCALPISFDGIVVTAAAPHIPPALIAQLKTGARMVIPVGGDGFIQHLKLVTKRADGGYDEREIIPVRFVPLVPGKR